MGALIGGFFLGQSVKVEIKTPTDDKDDSSNVAIVPTNDNETFAKLVDEPDHKPKSPLLKFGDLGDEIVDKYTADFDNLNQAERMFCKREFQENPELITKYPILAKLLGFEIEESNDTQPL